MLEIEMFGWEQTKADKPGIEEFSALISNNSDRVCIVAAFQTPVVDLYTLTNPRHTPWMVSHGTLYHDVPCNYCYKSIRPMGHQNWLQLASPELVVDAALDLIKEQQED